MPAGSAPARKLTEGNPNPLSPSLLQMNSLKQELAALPIREQVLFLLAVLCMVAAMVVIFIAMFTAPKGEIHTSVLTYFGISLGFVGSVFGISTHYNAELEKLKQMVADATKRPA